LAQETSYPPEEDKVYDQRLLATNLDVRSSIQRSWHELFIEMFYR
jgi:hypothetical protein